MKDDLNITLEVVAQARRLFETVMVLATGVGGILDTLYRELRIGGGFFKGRRIAEPARTHTYFEATAYIAALLTVSLENMPNKPPELGTCLRTLEAMLFDVQRVNIRPSYDRYRERYYDDQLTKDPFVFSHAPFIEKEFYCRIKEIWSFPIFDEAASYLCGNTFIAIHKNIETQIRRTISELWPTGGTESTPAMSS